MTPIQRMALRLMVHRRNPTKTKLRIGEEEKNAKFDLQGHYARRGLQVIVKLANIQLTPEKPEYEGGSWHVERQMVSFDSESQKKKMSTERPHRCYCLSIITLPRILLPQRSQFVETRPLTSTHKATMNSSPRYSGARTGNQLYKRSAALRAAKAACSPSPHHRVGPFKLANRTKPGHRKIVALFLVDPNTKMISTAHVPCQQQEWWWGNQQILGLPIKLQDHILKNVDFPFSLEEAKTLRLELMMERKAFVLDHGKAFESSTFSLCEH